MSSASDTHEDGQKAVVPRATDSEPPSASQDYPVFFAVLLVGVLTVLVFRGVGNHVYVYDDVVNVANNPYLYPFTWENLEHFWTEPYANLYVPVTYSVLAVEAQFAAEQLETGRVALDPSVFHYGNLTLHVANVLLVLVLLRAVIGQTLPAMAGALLFAMHPLQAETVNWITETKGLLAAMFGVLAVWQYWLFAAGNLHPLSSKPCSGSISSRQSRRWLHYTFATLAFSLALLSKPSAVAVPLVVLVLDAGLLRRGFLATMVPTAVWFCLALAAVVVTRGEQSLSEIHNVAPLVTRPMIAGDALAFYLYKLAVPWWLCVDYGRQPSHVLGHWWGYATWLIPVVLGGALLLLAERRKWLVFAAVFLAGVVPVLGFVPFGFQNISTVADRYAYFAMLGPALALAWVVERYDRPAILGATVAVLAVYGGISSLQTQYWRDSRTLFEHVLQVNQRSITANLWLGNLVNNTDRPTAERYYRAAHEIDPNDASANASLGTILLAMGNIDEAVQHLRASLEAKPNNLLPHFYLAQASGTNYAEARTHYEATLRINPRFKMAVFQFAWLLATCPDETIRDGKRAMDLLAPYVKDQQAADPAAIDALAAAYVETGDFDAAVATAENLYFRVRANAEEDSQWIPYRRAIQKRLQRYRAGKPYRGGPTYPLVPSKVRRGS